MYQVDAVYEERQEAFLKYKLLRWYSSLPLARAVSRDADATRDFNTKLSFTRVRKRCHSGKSLLKPLDVSINKISSPAENSTSQEKVPLYY